MQNNKGMKVEEYTLHQLAAIFAKSDATAVNYLKGSELVKIFQQLGFKDYYSFTDGGIIKANGERGLSRTKYTVDRLTQLNKKGRIKETISLFLENVNDRSIAEKEVNNILKTNEQIGDTSSTKEKAVATNINREANDIIGTEGKTSTREDEDYIDDVIFGKIPKDRPIVFISYSWDDEPHKKWVQKFAKDLTDNGIYVLFDQYVEMGTDFPTFMEHGIKISSRVLIVGTPQYKERSEGVRSGAAYEGTIINSTFYNEGLNITKFIPCLRRGTFRDSFPQLVSTRKGFDFSNDVNYNDELMELCKRLYSETGSTRPKLGPKPSYINN